MAWISGRSALSVTRMSVNGRNRAGDRLIRYRLHLKDRCERCGFVPEAYCQLTVHQLDKNHKNNDPLNLQTLCHNCHNLVHQLDRASAKLATS